MPFSAVLSVAWFRQAQILTNSGKKRKVPQVKNVSLALTNNNNQNSSVTHKRYEEKETKYVRKMMLMKSKTSKAQMTRIKLRREYSDKCVLL